MKKAFEEVEKPVFPPLPVERFPFFHEGKRKVKRNSHIEVDKARYFEPPEDLIHKMWVRWDAGSWVLALTDRRGPAVVHTSHAVSGYATGGAGGGVVKPWDW